jgi:O-antigen/teichoic acid export membrane protein
MGKIKGAAFLISGRVLQAMAQLVAVPIYIDQLGKPAYGVCLFALIVGGYLSLLDLGFTIGSQKPIIEAFAAGQTERAWRIYRSQFSLVLLVAFFAFAVITLVGVLIPSVYEGATAFSRVALFACAGLYVGTNYLHNALGPALLARERYARLSTVGLTQSFLGIGLSIVFVLIWPTPLAWMAAQALGNVLNLILHVILIRLIDKISLVGFCFDREIAREVTRYGLRAYVAKVWGTLATGSDRFLLRVFAGTTQLTEYAVPARVIEVAIQFIRPAVDTTLPDLTKAQMRSESEFARLTQRASLFWLFVGCALFVVPAGFSDPFFSLWLRANKPEPAALIFLFLSVYFALELYYSGLTATMLAKGQLHRMAPFSIWNAFGTVLLTYPAFLIAGLPGIAGMNACIDLIQLVPIVLVVRRYGAFELNVQVQLIRSATLIALAFGCAGLGYWVCSSPLIIRFPWIGLIVGACASILFSMFCIATHLMVLPSAVQNKLSGIPGLSRLFQPTD